MPCTAETPIPFIDPNKDPAIFVKALATQPLPPPLSPDNSVRQFAGYATMTTAGEFTRLLNNHLPVEVYFEETSVDAWAGLVVFDREVGLGLAEMYKYCETVDYFGGQEGGTTIITELALEDSPTKMEDWVKAQDWSFLFK
ncbi:hypothetical protein A1O3_06756 [Capronia epimyces CBS 606.96]|uniref:NmrA-like domain-containing protein n=1 Tax=Capronia epimyces CBS 606.96 TaxID=1182542 RepID=W9YL01_9EURO|nr:uncharacterized protein A1O3_06756 [Capronia epimyces CBS 606.96]EXJ82939.1 hypothetical protein A1O3_06756 [Capronia epimyces CBS 606.96]